ncbi:hypothetical protein GCM10020255_068410 [Rhodococcus baikonurensis]
MDESQRDGYVATMSGLPAPPTTIGQRFAFLQQTANRGRHQILGAVTSIGRSSDAARVPDAADKA